MSAETTSSERWRHWKKRAEIAEKRVAELEAELTPWLPIVTRAMTLESQVALLTASHPPSGSLILTPNQVAQLREIVTLIPCRTHWEDDPKREGIRRVVHDVDCPPCAFLALMGGGQ